MFTTSRKFAAALWLPVACAIVGCQTGPSSESRAATDSVARIALDNARLMQQIAENSRMMTDISRDLARVNVPKKLKVARAESPMQASRDSLVARIHYVTNRVKELEPKLAEAERRVENLTMVSDSLRTQLAATMQSTQAVIDGQKQTIDSLNLQVAALKDTITNMATESNKVYYIIGTRNELEQKGIVREVGGARFLFVLWKSGKTLVPARHFDPSSFTMADRRSLETLPLPAAGKSYRIVSRQDVSALETPPADNGNVTGQIKIADSARFWANSKYLILVES